MPDRTAKFIVEELVAELRRRRPSVTLTAIAGEYGESERNFRRYLRGGAMPLGKGRRFARRLEELHFATVAALERLAQSHPKGPDAAEPLRAATNAFEEGYAGLRAALDERQDIVRTERVALVLKRTQPAAETLAQAYEAARLRSESLRQDLAHVEIVIRDGVANAI